MSESILERLDEVIRHESSMDGRGTFRRDEEAMSYIPADVARIALQISPAGPMRILNAIANAIMAERERCAKIVDEIGNGLMDMTPAEAAHAIRRGKRSTDL